MAVVVPTITAANAHIYREQIERIEPFARRVHIDLMDGEFAPTRSLDPAAIWWPDDMQADVHLMFQHPAAELDTLIALSPDLVIVSAESQADFGEITKKLNQASIKAGLALLADTTVESVAELIPYFQHVLVFSGNLGYQGGSFADLKLLEKVKQLKELKPDLEIGWDGGVNETNLLQLAQAGANVINSGGFIQTAPNPGLAYKQLTELLP